MDGEKKAKRIVQAILNDLADRRGLRQEWEQIDDDVREDIIKEWETLVLGELFVS